MKSLIIGVIKNYDWRKVEVWALSAVLSGYKGSVAVIMYDDNEEVEQNFASLGIQVIKMPLRGPIFQQRFYDIAQILRQNAESFDYVIATDVRDVMFQRDPAAWLDANLTKGVYAATEALRYCDEPWGHSNLAQAFGADGAHVNENPIYNAGVISGRSKDIADLFYSIGALSGAAKPVVGGGGPDQAAYNVLLATEGHKATTQYGKHEDGYAAQLGTTADPHKIASFRPHLLEPEPTFEDGEVKTSTGVPYCIVHQYDRNPAWEQVIRQKLNEKLAAAKSEKNGQA